MASLNVNSLTYSKILHIKEMMDKLNILALIDTRISPANEKKLQNIWNSKQKFNDIIPGQITEMTFTFSNVDFQIFFIYGPSEFDNPA